MNSSPIIAAGCAMVLALAGSGCAQERTAVPEFGAVKFASSFNAGMDLAATKKAPVFLLFQEVPG